MEYHDFREDDVFSMKGKTTIWTDRVIEVGLQFNDERGKREQVLRYIDAINAQIDWIVQNRGVIADMLVKDGMLSMAEDRITGDDDLEEGETRNYTLEDGSEVTVPLSEKVFKSSLRMESIVIDLTGGRENQSAELYVFCIPDYFKGHRIVLDVERDGTITCRGLTG
jgi:hypothetical protein